MNQKRREEERRKGEAQEMGRKESLEKGAGRRAGYQGKGKEERQGRQGSGGEGKRKRSPLLPLSASWPLETRSGGDGPQVSGKSFWLSGKLPLRENKKQGASLQLEAESIIS